MSEDSLNIEFKSENLHDVKYRGELEVIYRMYISKDEISDESSIEYIGNKAIFFSAFYSVDMETLDSLFAELEEKGVKDLIAIAWYHEVGEEMYFIRRNKKLLEFESLEEMEDYLKEMEKGVSNISINYQKESKENTILIRLHIKAKGKRKKLFDLFSSTINSSDTKYFKKIFTSFIKSDTHDIEWCKVKWKDRDSWNVVCPAELSKSITDVIDIDEYLVLAFNLDKISSYSDIKLDDFIWFIFSELDGVKKVWIKYRPKNCRDQYLHFPGMGDESFFKDKYISNDNDWPKL